MGFFDLFKRRQLQTQQIDSLFVIKSNVFPEYKGYNVLNEDELIFLKKFKDILIASKIDPNIITLTRLSDGTFNVTCSYCYIGKIGLHPVDIPDKYAVLRAGAKRALRVLDTREAAEAYMKEHNGTSIEFRPGIKGTFYMQYLVGLYGVKEIETHSLQKCIDAIPKWIKYIKYCKRSH